MADSPDVEYLQLLSELNVVIQLRTLNIESSGRPLKLTKQIVEDR